MFGPHQIALPPLFFLLIYNSCWFWKKHYKAGKLTIAAKHSQWVLSLSIIKKKKIKSNPKRFKHRRKNRQHPHGHTLKSTKEKKLIKSERASFVVEQRLRERERESSELVERDMYGVPHFQNRNHEALTLNNACLSC